MAHIIWLFIMMKQYNNLARNEIVKHSNSISTLGNIHRQTNDNYFENKIRCYLSRNKDILCIVIMCTHV